MPSIFQSAIQDFNKMYDLPMPRVPEIVHGEFTDRAALAARLRLFISILDEEILEGDALISDIKHTDITEVEILTELADWLGDIQIYCASEMAKFGLDNDVVLAIIMASNNSKLAADGSVLKDGRGKVMKGPGYWKPDALIRKYIIAAQS